MTVEGAVRVEGLAALTRTMRKAGEDITELKDAHTRVSDIVTTAAADRAPRNTGALSQSLRPAKQANRARVMAGSAKVPYAGPIHWGWPAHNIEPQPFLSDAAVETQPQWIEQYQADVQKALDKVRGV